MDMDEERQSRQKGASEIVMIAGEQVTTFMEGEGGIEKDDFTITRERWWHYWPSGTVVLDHHREILGFKLGRVWLDPLGLEITNFAKLISAPILIQISEDQQDELRQKFATLYSARRSYARVLDEAVCGALEGGDEEADT
jgi:hypothetical protein